MSRYLQSLGCLLLLSLPALAAPPTLTSLFPAGGQIGTIVEVIATGNFDKWPVEIWTSDTNISGKAGQVKGKLSVTVGANVKPGIAWIRLINADGASPLRPFLVGVLPEVAEQEPNDTTTKPQAIERSCVVNGKLAKSGDVDVYEVTLKKNQVLVASLEAHHRLRSPMDAVLQVVSDQGFVLDQNHDHHGLDPQLVFTAPQDGRYLVRIFAFPSQPDSSIRFFGSEACVYRLTLTTAGFEDYSLPLAVTRSAPGKPRSIGWNLGVAPVVPGAVGVREENHPCHDVGLASDTVLSPPFTLTGQIRESHMANTFRVKVTKGRPLIFQVESRTLELPLTPVLRVLASNGDVLAKAEPAKPNTDCELTLTPKKDEIVSVEVRDLFHEGGERFVYRLRVVPPEPDVTLTVASDRFALAPGKPLEIPVTVTRKNGFALPLDLKAEGLPAGVTMGVTPAKGKDDKTLVVQLNCKNAPLSTAFRLIGTVKDQPAIVRPVTAALTEFDTTTQDLWLTVNESATVSAPPAKKKK